MQEIWGKCCYKPWKKQRRTKMLSLGLWNYWIVKTTGSWFKELIRFTWHFTSLINFRSTFICSASQISLPESYEGACLLGCFRAWNTRAQKRFSSWAPVHECPSSGTRALRRMTMSARRSQLCPHIVFLEKEECYVSWNTCQAVA